MTCDKARVPLTPIRISMTIRFQHAAALAGLPAFSGAEVLRGSSPDAGNTQDPGRVWVEVDGASECLCFYGAETGAGAPPLIYLRGDSSYRADTGWSVADDYATTFPYDLQVRASQVAAAIERTFIDLARPGVYGSSGNHQQRRRLREVKLVDAAISALKHAFGWTSIDLAGQSGGGHLVAALMARRCDIGVAVIASGNVAVRRAIGSRVGPPISRATPTSSIPSIWWPRWRDTRRIA